MRAFAQTNLFRSGQILFPSGQHLHSYTSAGNPIFRKAKYPRDINENLIATTMNQQIPFTPHHLTLDT
ncbi:hypothetical protein, partial [Burkholderia sp. KCJ3K979]|uniref:hypothetical protein n=1 Tax=Burkholderia sp. KCJ3K979 TaxID=2759149 RepID=UPI001F2B1313